MLLQCTLSILVRLFSSLCNSAIEAQLNIMFISWLYKAIEKCYLQTRTGAT